MLANFPVQVPRLLGAIALLLGCASLHAQQDSVAPTTGDRVRTVVTQNSGRVGGLSVDSLGYIYSSDFQNSIWRIAPHGEVELYATGFYGASGNALDSRGNLFQANFHGNTVSLVDRQGHHEIVAEGFNGPVGIAVDSEDNFYVCNCRGNTISRVRREDRAGKYVVSEYATSELFQCPNGITRDSAGNLFVVNFSDGNVLKVDTEGQVTLFATLPGGGNGHITQARGVFYATSFRGHKIYRVSKAGAVELLAGNGTLAEVDGPALEASLAWPNGIAVGPNQDRLYTNDFINRAPPTLEVPPKPVFSIRQITLASLADALAKSFAEGGIEGLEATYEQWRSNPSAGTFFVEWNINRIGYQFLTGGQVEAAVKIFTLNVEANPESWNGYDSLAEAQAAAGRREEAIRSYKRSLELNPKNENGRRKLEELESE